MTSNTQNPGGFLKMTLVCDSTSSSDNDEKENEKESDFSKDEEVEKISDAKRPKKLLDAAFQNWKSGTYTDVTVVIRGRKFVAHRLVLASLSDYFPPLLKFDENDSGEVTLHDIEPDDFFILLNYAYTGNVDVNKENVQSVLIAADYLSVDQVKQMCIKFMTSNFDVENIIDVILFGIEYTLPELILHAKQFLQKNFTDVLPTENFSKLEPKFLENFFSDNDLVLYSNKTSLKSATRESLILNAVLRYLSMRPDCGPDVIEMLIRTVRLPLVPTDKVTTCLNNYKSFKKNPIIQKYIQLREVAVKHIQERKRAISKTNSPKLEEIPDSWFQLRKRAVFSFVKGSMRYAPKSRIEPTSVLTLHLGSPTDCDLEIRKIKIWLRQWNERLIVGGLALWYQNPSKTDDDHSCHYGNRQGRCQHTIELEPDEFIVKVTVGSSFVINRLGFETNQGKVFGPFGGPGGSVNTESCPLSALSYLYDINCDVANTQGSETIASLVLKWITFS